MKKSVFVQPIEGWLFLLAITFVIANEHDIFRDVFKVITDWCVNIQVSWLR